VVAVGLLVSAWPIGWAAAGSVYVGVSGPSGGTEGPDKVVASRVVLRVARNASEALKLLFVARRLRNPTGTGVGAGDSYLIESNLYTHRSRLGLATARNALGRRSLVARVSGPTWMSNRSRRR